jgi:dolichyl-phosphate-mannose-protein mannosyltransferase
MNATEGQSAGGEAIEPPSWGPMDTVALTLMTLLSGLIRYVNLATPSALIFDEVYYAKDACFYLSSAASVCKTDYEITYVHPPLAKWLIAIGVRLFGFDSFGWRIMSVVAGTITVALLYLLARKILHSTLGAVLASGLLAIDLLHFVQSRVSMLDVFVPLFGVAAFLFLAYDRDRMLERLERPPEPEEERRRGLLANLLDRPWRLAAGLSAGAATACKWSGGLVLVAVIVLSMAWETRVRRPEKGGWGKALAVMLREEAPSIVLWLLVMPFLLYTVTFIGRVDGSFFAWPWTEGGWLNNFYHRQLSMYDFHHTLEATHSYQSPPWSWLLLKRPVSYFYETTPAGEPREIMATGSPFVWWSSILALLYTGVTWIRSRDFRDPAGLIFAGFALTYLPWLAFARPAVFIFYLLPAVPFMYLAIAYVAVRIGESWEARTAIGIFAVGAVGLFVFYFPLVTGKALPQSEWDQRIWIFKGSQCDPPPAVSTTVTVTATKGKRTVTDVKPTKKVPESVPPVGWCWI